MTNAFFFVFFLASIQHFNGIWLYMYEYRLKVLVSATGSDYYCLCLTKLCKGFLQRNIFDPSWSFCYYCVAPRLAEGVVSLWNSRSWVVSGNLPNPNPNPNPIIITQPSLHLNILDVSRFHQTLPATTKLSRDFRVRLQTLLFEDPFHYVVNNLS